MHQEFNILQKNREAVVKLLADLSLDQLNAIPLGFNNNIIWNMGHMVVVQEMLTYGLSKLPYTIEEFILVNFKKIPGRKGNSRRKKWKGYWLHLLALCCSCKKTTRLEFL
ncbi:MAG: DinB family protein [Saprospiraceae bacterium]|nr:DinB family protein [Saprospiraceae bacterium]